MKVLGGRIIFITSTDLPGKQDTIGILLVSFDNFIHVWAVEEEEASEILGVLASL